MSKLKERVSGIEPPSTPWKRVVLPLNHTRNVQILLEFYVAETCKFLRKFITFRSIFVWSGAAESNRESSAPKADMLTITPAPALLIYQMIFPKSKGRECDIM